MPVEPRQEMPPQVRAEVKTSQGRLMCGGPFLGNYVVVLWRHKLENPKTGDSFDLPTVSVYRMESTKIMYSRMFHFDTAALLRFLEHNAERPASQAPECIL